MAGDSCHFKGEISIMVFPRHLLKRKQNRCCGFSCDCGWWQASEQSPPGDSRQASQGTETLNTGQVCESIRETLPSSLRAPLTLPVDPSVRTATGEGRLDTSLAKQPTHCLCSNEEQLGGGRGRAGERGQAAVLPGFDPSTGLALVVLSTGGQGGSKSLGPTS